MPALPIVRQSGFCDGCDHAGTLDQDPRLFDDRTCVTIFIASHNAYVANGGFVVQHALAIGEALLNGNDGVDTNPQQLDTFEYMNLHSFYTRTI